MAREHGPVWSMLVVLCLAGCTASQSPAALGSDDLSSIGGAVARNLDSLNGFPTVILDEYLCDSRFEPCRDRENHWDASLVDASTLVSAFAEALSIPVMRYSGYGPRCEWDDSSDLQPLGLWADFFQPEIYGDSARVELMTGCIVDRRAFSQIHEFVLERDGRGVWEVVSRRLRSIT